MSDTNKIDLDTYIVEQTLKLFINYGIHKISMEDIARKCGISKKTLYKIHRSKDALLKTVITYKLQRLTSRLIKPLQPNLNAIEEFCYYFVLLKQEWKETSVLFYYDLNKYYDEGYKYFIEAKNNFFYQILIENYKWGYKEALYNPMYKRNQIKLFCFQLDLLFFKMPLEQAINQKTESFDLLFEMYLRSIVSAKGAGFIK